MTAPTLNLGHDDCLISEAELLAYLKISDRSLRYWRAAGKAPRHMRIGKHNRYRVADVHAWLDTRYAA